MKLIFSLCILAIPFVFVASLLAHSFGWIQIAKKGGLLLLSLILVTLSIRGLVIAYHSFHSGEIAAATRAGSLFAVTRTQSPVLFPIALMAETACSLLFLLIGLVGIKSLFTGRNAAA